MTIWRSGIVKTHFQHPFYWKTHCYAIIESCNYSHQTSYCLSLKIMIMKSKILYYLCFFSFSLPITYKFWFVGVICLIFYNRMSKRFFLSLEITGKCLIYFCHDYKLKSAVKLCFFNTGAEESGFFFVKLSHKIYAILFLLYLCNMLLCFMIWFS